MKKNFIGIIIFFFSTISLAADTINITSGTSDPIPLAINNFAGVDPADLDIAKNVVAVITSDLKASGMFRPISRAAFIENKVGIGHEPLFAAWQQINASLLINGEVTRTSSQKLEIKFIVWDTISQNKMISDTLQLPEALWRRAAHKISDAIYKRITGYDGYFNTRIVYVSESGDYLKRIKRLAIMDYDGENHRYLTDGSDLVLTPRFSPDGKHILYLSLIHI